MIAGEHVFLMTRKQSLRAKKTITTVITRPCALFPEVVLKQRTKLTGTPTCLIIIGIAATSSKNS